jgi:hypothetical protein
MMVGPAVPAAAVDLTIEQIEVTQAVQFGATPLVANNATFVRVLVGVDDARDVMTVDAVLRVYVDDAEVEWSPIHSVNGPIDLNADDNPLEIDTWLNFVILPGHETNVSVEVELDPLNAVDESDETNNMIEVSGLEFECRATVDIAYVPIDYTFDGSGLPDLEMIEPGVGDGFVRAIYSVGEWNYYRSPLPTFSWDQDVNETDIELLLALQDLRVNQLPGIGVSQPEFIFGWLPGNPYGANGRAISAPGDTAFGNTQAIRFQRTFAHELGHLFGLGHNISLIETIGIDVEHHLFDPQGLEQAFAPDLNDVMVAGLLTHEAFVNENTYTHVLADPRTMCGAAAMAPQPMLRVCGSIDHETGEIRLDPVTLIERARATVGAPVGDIRIVARGADDSQLSTVVVNTATTRSRCHVAAQGQTPRAARSPFHVLVPAAVDGVEVASIEIETAGRDVIARVARSASHPEVSFTYVGPAGGTGNLLDGGLADHAVTGPTAVHWSGADLDGDAVTYNLLYSPDGGDGWLPLALRRTGTSFEFDTADIPASFPGEGRLRLVATDGLNNTVEEIGGIALGENHAPDVHLFTPNAKSVQSLAAPIAFHAAVWDLEEHLLGDDSIVWSSTRDGIIGTGRLFITDDLSVGVHRITVVATDGEGQVGVDKVIVEIMPRDVFDADIDNDGSVNVLDLVAIINNWGPCDGGPSQCPADVTGNGQVNVEDLIEVLFAWES